MDISIYKDSTDTKGAVANYKRVLKAIKDGQWKGDIEFLRLLLKEGNKAEYDSKKRMLPSATFSGKFSQRQDGMIESYTQMIAIDIDHLSSEQMEMYTDSLQNDKYVHCFFTSPSNEGLKILIKVSSMAENHLEAYLSLEKYFKDNYIVEVDKKCKNISRLCYVSYDPNLYLNDESEVWQVDTKFVTTSTGSNSFDKRPERFKGYVVSKDARQAFEVCVKWTERTNQYVEGNRNNFVHILACNMNRAGVFLQDAILLAINRYSDLPDKEVEQVFRSAYKRGSEHNTIDIYADKDLPEHTEEELSMSIEESNVYETTLDLIKSGVKKNNINMLVKILAKSKGFTDEETDVLMGKAFKKMESNSIEHKSAEDFILDAIKDFKDNGAISTTVPEFDEALGGGLMPANFYGLIGKGGTYKSILAQWIGAENARNGGLTLYVNSEMSLLLLLDRVVEKELNISLIRGLKDKTINMSNISDITSKLKDVMNGNFEIINGSGHTRQSLVSTITDIEDKTGKKVSLVIIDGLSQLEDTKKNEIHSAIFNSGEMKEVAKETNTVVIALIHVSGGIEQHVRDTSKHTRAGDKVLNNMDAFFGTSLLIDEHSSNMDQGDIMYLPGKFYLRMTDKRGSGAVLNKIIQVHRPLRLEPLSVDPSIMEVSVK